MARRGVLARRDVSVAHVKRRRLTVTGLAVTCAVALSGCGESLSRGLLPHGVTDQSGRIIALWNGSWLAALGVGVIVWGLIIWCIVAYRRKKDDVGLPEQLRYNVPIEIFFTVVPLLMIAVLPISHGAIESMSCRKPAGMPIKLIGSSSGSIRR